jgi:hypothetical protein
LGALLPVHADAVHLFHLEHVLVLGRHYALSQHMGDPFNQGSEVAISLFSYLGCSNEMDSVREP